MLEKLVFSLILLNIATLGWLIFLNAKYKYITKKAAILLSEKTPANLSEMLNRYLKDVKKVEDHCFLLNEKLNATEKISKKGFHKIGFLRYNPFGDVGGNQSFTLCLLDGADNGFVISSIHSREGTRVYSKTVTSGSSEFNLSDEEKKAIEIAKK